MSLGSDYWVRNSEEELAIFSESKYPNTKKFERTKERSLALFDLDEVGGRQAIKLLDRSPCQPPQSAKATRSKPLVLSLVN